MFWPQCADGSFGEGLAAAILVHWVNVTALLPEAPATIVHLVCRNVYQEGFNVSLFLLLLQRLQ